MFILFEHFEEIIFQTVSQFPSIPFHDKWYVESYLCLQIGTLVLSIQVDDLVNLLQISDHFAFFIFFYQIIIQSAVNFKRSISIRSY